MTRGNYRFQGSEIKCKNIPFSSSSSSDSTMIRRLFAGFLPDADLVSFLGVFCGDFFGGV